MAAEYMQGCGYKILDRNYRTRSGEIDIIAREGGYIVFAEVKYRKNNAFGTPLEAVDYKKQQKIRRMAHIYLHNERYPENTPVRFDVVGITNSHITLIKNAF